MKTEIEVKFCSIDISTMREKLQAVGAVCEQPMRIMKRVVIDNDFMRTDKDAFLRVRDEGDKATMTYKQFDSLSLHGAKEIEITVSNFDDTVALLERIGLVPRTYQETKRETWRLGGVEIVLDEWPWLNPYIEIEGESEIAVRETAKRLGFNWEDAVFGDVMAAYRIQYPHLKASDTIGSIAKVGFDLPLPKLFGGKA